MRKHIGMMVLAVLVLVLLVVYTVAFQVSQSKDLVVVTTFGNPTRVLSGRDPNEAGLHFKWLYPAEEEVRRDARTFLMEDTIEETSTQDKKTVNVSVFCAWRIEDPVRFLSSIRTVEAATEQIKTAVRNAKTQAIGRYDLSDLINTDPAKMKLPEVEQKFTEAVSQKLRDDYGVKVVMIGVKRLGLGETVSAAVIDTMKAERQAKAADYQASGEAHATAIKARATAASDKIRAFAGRKAQEVKTQGDQAAAAYYAKFQGNEDLAVFLRGLEALKKALPDRSIILLDKAMMPMVEWFRTPPTVESLHQMTTTQPAESR